MACTSETSPYTRTLRAFNSAHARGSGSTSGRIFAVIDKANLNPAIFLTSTYTKSLLRLVCHRLDRIVDKQGEGLFNQSTGYNRGEFFRFGI